ncbi:MAG TPA: DUF499 domain-containing protein [Verrucomicrobiae bacterium]|nr:DUF499 domain-containing protein [Verrucomicrobiae bacterium]
MPSLKPWYKVVTPREDLRSGRPLDASEFAVHLDHIRDGRAPEVYQDPAAFFDRTYLTKNLSDLAMQVVRRLSGMKVETSAVFNLSTQFGGGKTHALTLLYHLARGGAEARSWKGVSGLLQDAGVTAVPSAATGVFVGTEFDSITGRGGADGTPLRKTPWGEIAYQLGGIEGFSLVEEHDRSLTAPGGDVIEKLLPAGRASLILLDEVMNYVGRSRKSGMAAQLYSFLHNLSEVARARDKVVLAVSIPASELEMTAEDQSDFERFKKLLDRLGKAVIMSAESETSEIIRRRLFEWSGIPKDAAATLQEYEDWLQAHKQQLPGWFPTENSRELLKASYPFHPALLSVFERKWQTLPRFQQTRGVLRILALWVSRAYSDGYSGAHKDPLITLGTAPLDDSLFRAALFEQLGEARLEAAVTTDIAGKSDSHAVRLDEEATVEIKKRRLHRKIATSILFESNGGQQRAEATIPEIRFAVGEPDLDIGNIEQCLESLTDTGYFLSAERNRYRFSFQPNLNKLLADRRAAIDTTAIEERVRQEIRIVFGVRPGSSSTTTPGIDRIYFPTKSGEIPDRPVLALVVVPSAMHALDPATKKQILGMNGESGSSSRTFKTALIWAAVDDGAPLVEAVRKQLAWEEIEADSDSLKLDEAQQRQLRENAKRAERDMREIVWRGYRHIFLFAEGNDLRHIDLGLVHSSSANSLTELILTRLSEEDIVADGVSPNLLVRTWPPALPEWSTKGVRDAFYASPTLPRLLKPDAVKETISRGLDAGTLAYVGKAEDGHYAPFVFKRSLPASDVEISDDVYLITRERAEAYLAQRAGAGAAGTTAEGGPTLFPSGLESAVGAKSLGAIGANDQGVLPGDQAPAPSASGDVASLHWSGEIPPQKWMNFYTKVLSRFATGPGLNIKIQVEVAPPAGIPKSKVDDTKAALRDLGMPDDVGTE